MKPHSALSGSGEGPEKSASTQIPVDQNSCHQPANRSSADRTKLLRALTELRERNDFPPFILASPAMHDILVAIESSRNSCAPVLIMGETGTGKELVARAIHTLSPRKDREYLAFNCAIGLRDLIESQLFGHLKGAFTGATSNM